MAVNQSDLFSSFVVPLYNTGDGIVKLLDAFRDLPIPGGYELILVNDASQDDTYARAKTIISSMPIPVTLIDMARSFGEHSAVLEGFRHARGQFIINLDDDLQNPVEEALKMLDHLRETGVDVVYAYYKEKKHHWLRNMASSLTNFTATLLLGKPKDLYLCSFRVQRRELIDRIIQYHGPYPYIDGLILGATNRIGRLMVRHEPRAGGQSGYTLRRLVRLWMNMFFNFSIMPLRVASLMGALLCVIGMIMLTIAVAQALFFKVTQVGWSSLMAAISLFSGTQLLILGVIGEYVGRCYMTLSGKPQSLIRAVIQHCPPTPPAARATLYHRAE
jgi:undecaprenyl-phosphate 4-deoxy-4-formamido-L-arabinose transferase